MTDSRYVVVHEVSNEPEAQVIASFLRSRGIETIISEDDAGDLLPALEFTRGVRIGVPEADEKKARELLEEMEEQAEEEGEEEDDD